MPKDRENYEMITLLSDERIYRVQKESDLDIELRKQGFKPVAKFNWKNNPNGEFRVEGAIAKYKLV